MTEGGGKHLLVVDDEVNMRQLLKKVIGEQGFQVDLLADGRRAIERITKDPECYDVIMLDIRLPGRNGIEVLRQIREVNKDVAVIMMTAYESLETAIEAIREGAYDYLVKPISIDEILISVNRALERKLLQQENVYLRKQVENQYCFDKIIGKSDRMQEVYLIIQNVLASPAPVLLEGESGTGKELVARAIHFNGWKKDQKFVAVDCGALPENLIESELFGHRKGAFTGASHDKTGLFEAANGGTIFLDEICNINASTQAKLLRVLQEGEIKRVGEVQYRKVDVRVISATNKNLKKEVQRGQFRDDLFYRLNVIHIKLPSLRERKEDIPLLADHFLQSYSRKVGKRVGRIEEDVMSLLVNYHWPGNVRQLENEIKKMVTFVVDGSNITIEYVSREIRDAEHVRRYGEIEDGSPLKRKVAGLERDLILEALKKNRWNKSRTAAALGLSRKGLDKKILRYGLDRRVKQGKNKR
jgi:two-component system response regulator PilR (NtrC family)